MFTALWLHILVLFVPSLNNNCVEQKVRSHRPGSSGQSEEEEEEEAAFG